MGWTEALMRSVALKCFPVLCGWQRCDITKHWPHSRKLIRADPVHAVHADPYVVVFQQLMVSYSTEEQTNIGERLRRSRS
jgi:hypothetical protein